MRRLTLLLALLTGAAHAQTTSAVMVPVTQLRTTVGTLRFSTPLLTPRAADLVPLMTTPVLNSYFRDMEKIARDHGYGRFCEARYILAKANVPLSGTVAFSTAYHRALLPYLKGISSSTEYTEFTNELGRQRQMVSIFKRKGRANYWINLFTYTLDTQAMTITACELK